MWTRILITDLGFPTTVRCNVRISCGRVETITLRQLLLLILRLPGRTAPCSLGRQLPVQGFPTNLAESVCCVVGVCGCVHCSFPWCVLCCGVLCCNLGRRPLWTHPESSENSEGPDDVHSGVWPGGLCLHGVRRFRKGGCLGVSHAAACCHLVFQCTGVWGLCECVSWCRFMVDGVGVKLASLYIVCWVSFWCSLVFLGVLPCSVEGVGGLWRLLLVFV